MAYDEAVAERVRKIVKQKKGITEKKMFGGLAFMLNGHMVCGVIKDELMFRLGSDLALEALKKKNTRPMDFTGKQMKSMIYLERAGFKKDADLKNWIDKAISFAKTLPPK